MTVSLRCLTHLFAILVLALPLPCRADDPDLSDPEVELLMNVLLTQGSDLYDHYFEAMTTESATVEPIRAAMTKELHFVQNLPVEQRPKLTRPFLTTESESLLLSQELLKLFEAQVTSASRQQLAELYNRRTREFWTPELRSVRYVSFLVGPDSNTEDEALGKARQWRARVLKDKEDFDAAADLLWKDQKGDGRLGPFDARTFKGVHTQTAFSLQLDELSQPVRSKIGYHIFKLTSITRERRQPLEEVLPALEAIHAAYAVRKAELAFFRDAAGSSITIEAPFMSMDYFTDLPPDTLLFRVNDHPPFTYGDCVQHLTTVANFTTVTENLCLPTIANLFRVQCLGVPAVHDAARQMPGIATMIRLLEAGEIARRWREANLKPEVPTAEAIQAYYDQHLEQRFRNPVRYWASLLLITKPALPPSTSRTLVYRVAGEWEGLQKEVAGQVAAGKSLKAIHDGLGPQHVKVEWIELEGKTTLEANKLFSLAAKEGDTGKVYGPAKARNEALFSIIHRMEPGSPIPLAEVRARIVEELEKEASRRKWNQILSTAERN